MTRVVNEDNPDYNTEGGNDTEDKVFLLSIEEANKYFTEDESRMCFATQYAEDNAYFTVNADTGTIGWWLRSPGYSGDRTLYVDFDGWVETGGTAVDRPDIVIRPALFINLE